MSDEEELNPAERELEAALGALAPSPPAIDRDRMMFEAGQRSVRPQHRRPVAWQVISGALAAALLVSVSLHRAPRHVEQIVQAPVESTTATTTTTTPDPRATTTTAAAWNFAADETVEAAPSATSYLVLRRHALSADPLPDADEPGPHLTRRMTRTDTATDVPSTGFFGRVPTTPRERL